MSSRHVLRDALNRLTMNAVVRRQVHRLRRRREAPPNVAGGALCLGYVNQGVKGEPEFVVIEEILVETELLVIKVRELAASRRELLPGSGPDLLEWLRPGVITSEPIPLGFRIQRPLISR